MDQEDGQEKIHDPTPRRLEQAREQGDVPRSMDVTAAAAYLGLVAAVLMFGAEAGAAFARALAPFLGAVDRLEGRVLGPGGLGLAAHLVADAALAVAPLFVIPMTLVIGALFAQQAFVAAGEKLVPKLDRISPLAQAKQKFGPSGLVEFAKSAAKMTLVSAGAWWWLTAEVETLVGLSRIDARALPAELARALLSLLYVVLAVVIPIAAIDYLWQRFDHHRKLRMSHEELKRDAKETEGDPHMRAKRRGRAEEIARNRMLLDVPKADVVIVNPEHYAVALAWTRKPGSAPSCVAKGVDEVAAQIRARAAEAGVPIHRDPPTARSLHAMVEIGQEIREEHYRAVAAAIRFAAEMRRRAAERSWR